ncbi:PREDICTED: heterogeneous nuclear ribonucleoprotein F-like isoform X1 [Amphimedon queenslandica]|uniref:RRM domain-containing protein n=1 Tax=Amphimedon queenslandica TaxID=400682 RepID=A0AAN0JGV4_AMPQE|nr:PREDICTED: heterogeneous nuclear ribonucleoprotein F-like isoform X1 [Amphimedon queenslandica]|eukprot:XP_019856017.1 PREDICTED: heterogeneous nuclear ribonucleoprotein F-like isoform X1 [Amphimedon queenslandica]
MASNGEQSMFYAVVVTGSPRETTEGDVRKFFEEIAVKEVKFQTDERGWRTGNSIYVQLETSKDFELACTRDGQLLLSQKVGVLMISKADYERSTGSTGRGATYNNGAYNQGAEGGVKIEHETPPTEPRPLVESYFVRLRGLPYSAMASDILDFLKDVQVKDGEKGVHFSFGSDGRVSGEAYVEVCSGGDVERALRHDRDHLGGRYIEVFRASQNQFEYECHPMKGPGVGGRAGGVVRLRGLPYGSTEDNIRDFFQGIAISHITMQLNESGRETGEAFVELFHEEDVDRALDRHKKVLGHRYIEVFRTTRSDIKPVADRWAKYSRPAPYPGGGGGGGGGGRRYDSDPYHRGAGYKFGGRGGGWSDYGGEREYYGHSRYSGAGRDMTRPTYSSDPNGGHCVRMRGLPYSASEREIFDFFSPLVPFRVTLEKDTYGRASGEGEVEFCTHEDAVNAMKKDRGHIGSRYVELFLHSSPGSNTSNSMGAAQYSYAYQPAYPVQDGQSAPTTAPYHTSAYPTAYYVATPTVPPPAPPGATYQSYPQGPLPTQQLQPHQPTARPSWQ